MKKVFTLLVVLLLVICNSQATPLFPTGTKYVTRGDEVKIADVTDEGYYILQSQGNPFNHYYESEGKIWNGITGSVTTGFDENYVVQIIKNGDAYNIKAYSGNYYQILNENQLTTGSTPVNYSIVVNGGNYFFKNSNYNLNNYNHNPQGTTGTGGYSQIKIYKANLENSVTITWNISYNDGYGTTKTTTYEQKVAENSGSVSCDVTYPFTTISGTTTVENTDVTANATATFSTPFKSSNNEQTHWYKIKLGAASSYYAYANSNGSTAWSNSGSSTAGYYWAFYGNPIDGYSIKNAIDETEYLFTQNGNNGTSPTLSTSSTTWTIATGNTSYANSFAFGYNGGYINQYGGRQSTILALYNVATDNGAALLVDGEADFATELSNALNEAKTKQATLGEGLGQYHDEGGALAAAIAKAEATGSNTTTEQQLDAISSLTNALNTALVLNQPKAGIYMKLQGEWNNCFLSSTLKENDDKTIRLSTITNGTGADVIWYYDGNSLLSYDAGKNAGLNKQLNTDGIKVYFEENPYHKGHYAIYFVDPVITGTANRAYFWNYQTNGVFSLETGQPPLNTGHQGSEYSWILSEVTDLPVEVHQSGDSKYYGTLHLPKTVTISRAEAYTVQTVGETSITLTPVGSTTIPAKTSIVLVGTDPTVTATVAEAESTDTIAGNLLWGSYKAFTTVTGTADDNNGNYYLGQYENQPGFFRTTRTKTAANKAYLPKENVPETTVTTAAKGFAFDFGTVTDIDKIMEKATVFPADAPRYNLAGQRVSDAYKGVIVVGGKKIVAK